MCCFFFNDCSFVVLPYLLSRPAVFSGPFEVALPVCGAFRPVLRSKPVVRFAPALLPSCAVRFAPDLQVRCVSPPCVWPVSAIIVVSVVP